MLIQFRLGGVLTTEHDSHKFLSSWSSDGAVVGDIRQIKPANTMAWKICLGSPLPEPMGSV